MIRVRWDRAAAESRCARIGLESTPGFVRDLHNYDVNAVAVRERARAGTAPYVWLGWRRICIDRSLVESCQNIIHVLIIHWQYGQFPACGLTTRVSARPVATLHRIAVCESKWRV